MSSTGLSRGLGSPLHPARWPASALRQAQGLAAPVEMTGFFMGGFAAALPNALNAGCLTDYISYIPMGRCPGLVWAAPLVLKTAARM